jgi:thiosulfate reductase cytochrome b subunit
MACGVLFLSLLLLPFCASGSSEDIDNETCLGCHNLDILDLSQEELAEQVEVSASTPPLRRKPLYVFGELALAIDEGKYAASVHGGLDCVECHMDASDIPHPQRLKTVQCGECHDTEELERSAHGKSLGSQTPLCIGCHDAHYGRRAESYASDLEKKGCLECHNRYGMDTDRAHQNLHAPHRHLSLGCLVCHSPEEPHPHRVPVVEQYVADCESCHRKRSILASATGGAASIFSTEFINKDALKKYGYIVGTHRIPALDGTLLLLLLIALGIALVHAGLRFTTRQKRMIDRPTERVLLHPPLERVWHWSQAACTIMLMGTGAVIHWPEKFPGWFSGAVSLHGIFGWIMIFLFILWLCYNLFTGRISHYLPRREEIPAAVKRQAKFYFVGIFRNDPQPFPPGKDAKFNPLQKLAYLKLQLIVLPLLLTSGVLYMYRESFKEAIQTVGGVAVLASIHLVLGAIVAVFLVIHIYLTTTGVTPGEHCRSMIFGYGAKHERPER